MKASDETRSKITELFEQFKPHLDGYHDYAQRVTALSEEYHKARFAEVFIAVPVEELTLLASIPAHQTPKSLDEFLAKLPAGLAIKRIIHDRKNYTYHIYV
jgi:hypothetical protein